MFLNIKDVKGAPVSFLKVYKMGFGVRSCTLGQLASLYKTLALFLVYIMITHRDK